MQNCFNRANTQLKWSMYTHTHIHINFNNTHTTDQVQDQILQIFFIFKKSLSSSSPFQIIQIPGVLHWYWEISVSCQFSIFRLFSVLFLSQNQHNKAKLLVFLALTGARPRSQDVCPVVISGQQSQLLLLSLLSALCGYCGAWSLSRYKLVSSE